MKRRPLRINWAGVHLRGAREAFAQGFEVDSWMHLFRWADAR